MIEWIKNEKGGDIPPLRHEETSVLMRAITDLAEKRLDSVGYGNLVIFGRYNWNGEYTQIAEGIETGTTETPQRHPIEKYFEAAALISDTTDFFTWSDNRIYTNTTTPVLVLNCEQGRFLVNCDLRPGSHLYLAHEILIAIALILSDLRPQDHVLRASCQELWRNLDQSISDAVANVSYWEKQFFYRSPCQALADWRKWRRDWEKVAELPGFFGEFSPIRIPKAVAINH